jgi:NitT/TauT family transport system substrate-binding protein
MVNPDFAKQNPKVVAGFVRATIKGIVDTIKDPEGAVKSVMKRNETAEETIELARLKMSLNDNFVTPWVKANGIGGIDEQRMAKAIEQIAVTYEFKSARPKPADIFTPEYLPPQTERKY